jgi:hypothetical protein
VYHSGSSASTRNRYVSVAGLHCAAATSGEISLNQVKIDTHNAATVNRTGAVMSRAPVRCRDGRYVYTALSCAANLFLPQLHAACLALQRIL